jgi:hypothetical protein
MKMVVGMTKKENNREHIVLHKVRDKDGADKSAPYHLKSKF